jgi:hypothetical protein
VFDWIVGKDCKNWNFDRRWAREIVGMSLRGLLQTFPAGYLMFWLGYGWEYVRFYFKVISHCC